MIPSALADQERRQASSEPLFRGRKLVLNYTDGSPCEEQGASHHVARREKELWNRKDDDDQTHTKIDDEIDDTDDDRADKNKNTDRSKGRRKSTILSLICDRELLAAKAHISFISASPDQCTYFFEAKSIAACGGPAQDKQTLGPGAVFGVMYGPFDAILVIYKRN